MVLRRLIQWTLIKQPIADIHIQLDNRNTHKQRFTGNIPLSTILASTLTEQTPRRELLAKNIFGRSSMKRMRQNYVDAVLYALEVMIPMNNTKRAGHEEALPGSKYVLVQHKPTTVVESVQKILSVWIQL